MSPASRKKLKIASGTAVSVGAILAALGLAVRYGLIGAALIAQPAANAKDISDVGEKVCALSAVHKADIETVRAAQNESNVNQGRMEGKIDILIDMLEK